MSNVTWTKDANLLATWMASSADNDGNGSLDVIDAIISASPIVNNRPNVWSPLGTYNITSSDFSSDGSTTWFGAMAYVNYLNFIKYGGSDKWYLPTAVNATVDVIFNPPTNGVIKGDELVELFYLELGGKTFDGFQDSNYVFSNEVGLFWTGTDYGLFPLSNSAVYAFGTRYGLPAAPWKSWYQTAWAVTSDQISGVPEPESFAMFSVGLGLVGGVVRRRKMHNA